MSDSLRPEASHIGGATAPANPPRSILSKPSPRSARLDRAMQKGGLKLDISDLGKHRSWETGLATIRVQLVPIGCAS